MSFPSRCSYLTAHQALGHPWPTIFWLRAGRSGSYKIADRGGGLSLSPAVSHTVEVPARISRVGEHSGARNRIFGVRM